MTHKPTNSDAFTRYRPIIDDWQGFCDTLAHPLPTCVWTNTLRTTPERLAAWMRAGGFSPEPVAWYPGAFKLAHDVSPGNRLEYVAGLYHVQEEVSLVPPVLLQAARHERVLDLCAAPGNKTAQLAVSMQNRGSLVANDRNVYRLRALRRVIDRLGVANISVTAYDGANFPPESGEFDKVLVDAPCSCEGTSRKNPEVVHSSSFDYVNRLAGTQRALLRQAVRRCRVGGLIVYSTCTYAPEENELVVNALLEESGPNALRLLPARIDGLNCSAGITHWHGHALSEDLSRTMRLWPHQNDTGGFFVALLKKTAEV